MKDVIFALAQNSEALRWLFFLALLWVFYRYVNSGGNPLRWWHFISSKGMDGEYYADLNKLGQVSGIAFGSFSVVLVSANAKSDFVGFAAVLTSYFAFVGGVAGYSAYLRSKSNQIQTVTTTEPVVPPAPQKTTVTQTIPSSEATPVPVKVVETIKTEEKK